MGVKDAAQKGNALAVSAENGLVHTLARNVEAQGSQQESWLPACANRLSLQLDQTQVFQDLQPGVLSGSGEWDTSEAEHPPNWPMAAHWDKLCVCSQVSDLEPVYPQRRSPRRRGAHLDVTGTLGSKVCVLPRQAGRACQSCKLRTSLPPTPALHLTLLNPGQVLWQLASSSGKSALNRKIQTPQTGSWAYTSLPGQPESSGQGFGVCCNL